MTLYRYNSWSEFVAEYRKPPTPGNNGESSKTNDDTNSFTGCTVAEWERMEVSGWNSIRPEIASLTDKVTDDLRPLMVDTFQSRLGFRGSSVDMGKYLAGNPVHMRKVVPQQIASFGRVVTILVNGTFASGVPTSDIMRRGVAICALVECVHLMQHSSEVWVEFSVDGIRDHHSCLVNLKHADDDLDIAKLMFALAHPAALRRSWFRFMESRSIGEIQDIGRTYGHPKATTQGDYVGANIDLPLLKYPFPDAEVWVRKYLMEYGLLGEGED